MVFGFALPLLPNHTPLPNIMSWRPPPFPQPFAANPAPTPTGTGHASYAAPNPAANTVHPSSIPGPGVSPFPQPSVRPPAHPYGHSAAHPLAFGSAGHPPAFPTPAGYAPSPSVLPPPTIQRTATIPMPGHLPVFPTTTPMTGQEATPHHNLYGAQSIPHARGNLIGNRVDTGHNNIEQRSSELDHPGSEGVLRSLINRPISGETGLLRRFSRSAPEPQRAGESCRYCGRPTSRENVERLNGFCSDGHMWDAIQAGTATRCRACHERACPPDRIFCSDRCGRG